MVQDSAALDFPKRLTSLPGLFGGGGRITHRMVDFERTHAESDQELRGTEPASFGPQFPHSMVAGQGLMCPLSSCNSVDSEIRLLRVPYSKFCAGLGLKF